MLGLFLLAWVVGPLLMLAVSLGLGLLVRRAAGGAPSGVFLLPIGFAAALVIATFFMQWGATAELAPVGLAVLAAAGLLLEGRTLLGKLRPSPRLVWPAAAAFVGFAVIAAPVVLTGVPSFTGYGRIVDLGHHFDYTAYLASHGHDPTGITRSSHLEVSRKLLAAGYPAGWQSALGAFSRLLGNDLIWNYQPLLAVTSAMGALSAYGLLSRAVESPALRALGAAVAIQANVLYAYGLVGGFKELTAASLLVLAAGLAAELSPRLAQPRNAVPLGVALAACLADFSLGILPWLGVIVAGFIVVTLLRSRERVPILWGWAAVGAVTLLLSIPALIEASKVATVAGKAEGASPSGRTAIADLGNLTAAIPVRAASGVWPAADYRFTANVGNALTGPFRIFVLALAVVGLVAALRRRDWGLVVLAAGAGVGLAYYMARTGPWLQLKAIAITGTVVLACAFAGAVAVGGWIRRGTVAAGLLAVVVGLGVVYGNALAYHDTTLAPGKRLHDLEKIGDRYAGQGPTLYPDFEEYAEYLLRREGGVGIVDPPPIHLPKRRPGARAPAYSLGFATDTDRFTTAYLQSYALIVRRRGPDRSRPPSNWKLAERTPYHEVWRKIRPASTVLAHMPYEVRGRSCSQFASRARRAARKGPVRIAYVDAADATTFPLGRAPHTPLWTNNPDSVMTYGEGQVTGKVRVPRSGDYSVWVVGGFGRAVRFSLDGKPLGTLKLMHSYADQYNLVGRRRLRAGPHQIQLTRGGGNVEPGDRSGAEVPVGPLKLVRDRPLPVRTAPEREARSICSRGGLDWLEIVRPRR